MSYLLQGVESAWDSVGRRKPQSQTRHKVHSAPAYPGAADGAADGAAAATLSGFKPQEDQEPGGGGGESLRGAEAMVDVPRKGSNVSSVIITANSISANDNLYFFHCLPAEGGFTGYVICLFP